MAAKRSRREPPVFILGDIHGEFAKLTTLLREANLATSDLAWSGGDAIVWFMGDFFDRGEDGIAVVDLVMRLQEEASRRGGRISALLGNHEVVILAARLFRNAPICWPGMTFNLLWKLNGGCDADMDGLTPRHVEWLKALPAMAHEGDRLLAHADSTFYYKYGSTAEAVNSAFGALLQTDDPARWDRLLMEFADRNAFDDSATGSLERARRFLATFQGRQLIHGHTPISTVSGQPASQVTGPLEYTGGLCVNVDGGMYLGGAGFVYRLPPLDASHPDLPPSMAMHLTDGALWQAI